VAATKIDKKYRETTRRMLLPLMLATAGDLAGLQFAASMRFGRTPAPTDLHPNVRKMLRGPDGFRGNICVRGLAYGFNGEAVWGDGSVIEIIFRVRPAGR